MSTEAWAAVTVSFPDLADKVTHITGPVEQHHGRRNEQSVLVRETCRAWCNSIVDDFHSSVRCSSLRLRERFFPEDDIV